MEILDGKHRDCHRHIHSDLGDGGREGTRAKHLELLGITLS